MDIVIGIGGLAVADRPDATLKTFALASCVAVTAYSQALRVGGMIHIGLPGPPDAGESAARPGYYATTGVPLLLHTLGTKYGCQARELSLGVFGGADSTRADDIFRIGARNLAAVFAELAALELQAVLTDTGGNLSRTLVLEVGTGRVEVFTQPITF
ncbi:MAG: chemotaxis protein CheD [Peptococcaceae bacterium]|nr:chemotaxis protein CheD [Peptococcaceae bacterium]